MFFLLGFQIFSRGDASCAKRSRRGVCVRARACVVQCGVWLVGGVVPFIGPLIVWNRTNKCVRVSIRVDARDPMMQLPYFVQEVWASFLG